MPSFFDLAENPPPPPPPPLPAAGSASFFEAAENPADFIRGQGLADRRPWQEVAGQLKKYGHEPDDATRQQYELDLTRKRYEGGQEPMWRRMVDATPAGWGFSVGANVAYGRAKEAFNAGKATQDDLEKIASYERLQQIKATESAERQVLRAGLQLPNIAIGAGAGSSLTQAAAAGLGKVGVALPAGGLAGFAGRTAAMPLTNPTLGFYEGATAEAAARGRAAPSAEEVGKSYAHSAVAAAILGQVQKLAAGVPGGRLVQAPVGAVAGSLENEIADAATTALGLSTRYGPMTELLQGKKGDNAARLATNILTNGFFAGLHGGSRERVVEAGVGALNAEGRAGLSADRAAENLQWVHDAYREAVRSANPREEMRSLLRTHEGKPRPAVTRYAETLAESLPEAAPAEPARPEQPPVEGGPNVNSGHISEPPAGWSESPGSRLPADLPAEGVPGGLEGESPVARAQGPQEADRRGQDRPPQDLWERLTADHPDWTPEQKGREAARLADVERRERRIRRMTDETGRVTHELPIPNDVAYMEAEDAAPSAAKGFSDSDGLKALNDTFGYGTGNAMLAAKAEVLRRVGLDAYHQKGDEFLYRGGSPEELRSKLERAQELLREQVFTYTAPDGTTRSFKGAGFSFGVAGDMPGAKKQMDLQKKEREARGERGPRAQLGRIVEVGPGGQDQAGRQDQGRAAGPDRGPAGGEEEGRPQAARPPVAAEHPAGSLEARSAELLHGNGRALEHLDDALAAFGDVRDPGSIGLSTQLPVRYWRHALDRLNAAKSHLEAVENHVTHDEWGQAQDRAADALDVLGNTERALRQDRAEVKREDAADQRGEPALPYFDRMLSATRRSLDAARGVYDEISAQVGRHRLPADDGPRFDPDATGAEPNPVYPAARRKEFQARAFAGTETLPRATPEPAPAEPAPAADDRAGRVLQLRRSGRSLDSIGKELGITRERVRQIEAAERSRLGESGSVAREHEQSRAEQEQAMRSRGKAAAGEGLGRLTKEDQTRQKLSPEEQALERMADDLLAKAGAFADPAAGVTVPPGFPEPPQSQASMRGGIPGHPGGGPGGAREFALSRERVTAERGEPSVLHGEREPVAKLAARSDPAVWAEALSALARDPEAAAKVVSDIEATGRPPSRVETALLLQRRIALANAHDRAAAEYLAARERTAFVDGKPVRPTEAELEPLRRREEALLAERDRLDAVTETARNQLGGALRWFRQLAREDYTLGRLTRRAEVAKGKPLTADEKAEISTQAEAIRKADRELAAEEAKGGSTPEKRIAARKAREKFDAHVLAFRLHNRPAHRKLLGAAGTTANLARAIITSMDLSAVLRQGGFLAASRPLTAIKAIPAMFRSLASERAFDRAQDALTQRPNAPLYDQAKLYLADVGDALSKQEESFAGRLTKKIPGVAGSARAYTAYLNRLRADTFDAMTAALARNGQPTLDEAKAVANFVNVATGRGKLGQLEPAAGALSQVFFSPRYFASRLQLIAGQPLYGGTARTRKLVAQEYGRALVGLGVFYGLMSLANDDAKLEADPRSSDFGKVRLGNTRLDPLFGLAQPIVFGARMAAGQAKSTQTGGVYDLRGPRANRNYSAADVISNFFRSKLAPVPGTAVNVLVGRDVTGEKTTALKVVKDLTVPMSFKDVLDVMRDQGVPRGPAVQLLNLLGMGVQQYEPRK